MTQMASLAVQGQTSQSIDERPPSSPELLKRHLEEEARSRCVPPRFASGLSHFLSSCTLNLLGSELYRHVMSHARWSPKAMISQVPRPRVEAERTPCNKTHPLAHFPFFGRQCRFCSCQIAEPYGCFSKLGYPLQVSDFLLVLLLKHHPKRVPMLFEPCLPLRLTMISMEPDLVRPPVRGAL